MLMLVSMTLTQGHSGSENCTKKSALPSIIWTTKQASTLTATVGFFFFFSSDFDFANVYMAGHLGFLNSSLSQPIVFMMALDVLGKKKNVMIQSVYHILGIGKMLKTASRLPNVRSCRKNS